jgi:glycosyltransferase involved in cell wall biosynthesis
MMGWDMRSGLALTDGEYIAVIDGDGQMPVGDLVRVYQKIRDEDFDLVKTYRIKRGDTAWRKIISFFYNLFFHLLFPGLKARDINSKPKIFTRWAFEKFNLKSDDWFIDAEIMIQARRHKLKIGELPTVFLGLSGRRSFVKIKAIFEFIRNLIVYRIIEFMK